MLKAIGTIAAAAIVLTNAFSPSPAKAQSPAEFYDGNLITILIAFRPGGGFHLYSRILAQHLRGHIPGKPKIVMTFMPGAGGVKAANYFYNVAPKDGTYISLLSQTAAMFQRLNQGHSKSFRYDAAKFEYIGRLVTMDAAHMVYKTVPNRDIAKLSGAGTQIIACTSGKAAQGYINASVLAFTSGLNMKILTGYQGSRSQNLAMEQGECNYQPGAWNSWKARRADWLNSGTVTPVALTALQRHPDLPNVPTIVELAKTPEKKAIARFIAGYPAVGRAYAMPPGTPKDRVRAMRAAFDATVNDPAFIAEAKQRRMLLDPGTGEEVQKVVQAIIDTPDDIIKKTRAMLDYK